MSLEGKVVLVTGASAGIGEATALLFAESGARVALVGRREAALRAVAARCGPRALPIVADLATDAGCQRAADTALQHYGRLDVLVNNAGVGAREGILDASMETFDRVFALNVRGVYNLTRLLAPALIQSKGNIVNVSSIAGSTAYVGCLPYSLSKAALNHFSSVLALELAPKGVRVNTVSPGVTESTFVQRLTGYSDAEYKEWLRNIEKSIPLGGACSARDIAQWVVQLASPAAASVTGTNVVVDGGAQFVFGANDAIRQQTEKKE